MTNASSQCFLKKSVNTVFKETRKKSLESNGFTELFFSVGCSAMTSSTTPDAVRLAVSGDKENWR